MEKINEIVKKFDDLHLKIAANQKFLILDLKNLDYANPKTMSKVRVQYEINQEKL